MNHTPKKSHTTPHSRRTPAHKKTKKLQKHKKLAPLTAQKRFNGCGCGPESTCGTTPPEDTMNTAAQTQEQMQTIEKMRKQQRDFSLKLYRSILRAHRNLPGEMRFIGDMYVKEEFALHKNAQPQHLQGFYEQWIGYLHHLHEAFDASAQRGDGQAFDGSNLGEHIPHDVLDQLEEEKREKLFEMHDEAVKFFTLEIDAQHESGNTNAAAKDAAAKNDV